MKLRFPFVLSFPSPRSPIIKTICFFASTFPFSSSVSGFWPPLSMAEQLRRPKELSCVLCVSVVRQPAYRVCVHPGLGYGAWRQVHFGWEIWVVSFLAILLHPVIYYSRTFSSANNFVKSGGQAVCQEFIFVKRQLSLVCSRSFGYRSSAYCLSSHSWTFLIPPLVVLWKFRRECNFNSQKFALTEVTKLNSWRKIPALQ